MKWVLALVTLVAGLAISVGTAGAFTTVEKIPFEVTLTECGETISLSGQLNVVFTVQELGGGGFLVTSHANPQGVTGASSSGARYQATGMTTSTTVSIPSGGFTATFVNRFHIVGTMGAPTFAVTDTLHITITPNGDVTAVVDNFSLKCV